VAWIAYGEWLKNGIKPREFTTTVPADRLRDLFTAKVGGTGWKIVDDGNPMVAQSPLTTGMRQQISMHMTSVDAGRVKVRVAPVRWVTKRGTPTKGHTIRMRLNSLVTAVQQLDGSAQVSIGEHRRQ
jgi:hypothetical protein